MISQHNKIRFVSLIILIVAVAAIFLDFPEIIKKIGLNVPGFLDIPFRLGLDLKGGSHLVYEADVSNIPGSEQGS